MKLEWAVAVLSLALLWSVWVIWRRFVPGRRKRPSAATAGVAALLIVCVVAGISRLGRVSGIYGLEHTTRQTLRSGRELEVVSKQLRGRVWILEYRTRIPRRRHRKLEGEAEEVWKGIREEAEKAGATEAQLFPVDFSSELRFAGLRPVIVSNISSGVLILAKSPDGTWKMIHGWPPS